MCWKTSWPDTSFVKCSSNLVITNTSSGHFKIETWMVQCYPSACSSCKGRVRSWELLAMESIWAERKTWANVIVWRENFVQIKDTNSSDLLYAVKIRPVLIICNLFRMTPSLARPSSTGVILVKGKLYWHQSNICSLTRLLNNFFQLISFQFISFWSPFWVVPGDISPAEIIGEDIEEVGLRPKTGMGL